MAESQGDGDPPPADANPDPPPPHTPTSPAAHTPTSSAPQPPDLDSAATPKQPQDSLPHQTPSRTPTRQSTPTPGTPLPTRPSLENPPPDDGSSATKPGDTDTNKKSEPESQAPGTKPEAEGAAGVTLSLEEEKARTGPPYFVNPLVDLCITVIAENFQHFPSFGALQPHFVKRIISLLKVELPLELVGRMIDEEEYWRRRACVRWKNCDTLAHGQSWKQLYFERNLEAALERYDPTMTDVISIQRLLAFSAPYVHGLSLKQLPSHLDLCLIFDGLNNQLVSLSLTYGMRSVGMDYDRSLFGMKISDCRSLATALARTETLTTLLLPCNALDDEKVRMLANGLVENFTVTHLDLSHNRVADRGVRALAKLLDHRSVLAILDLSDNRIHAEGARALARALRGNYSLLTLNLRLNCIGDEGAATILDALRSNSVLQRLHFGSNGLGLESATSLRKLLMVNTTLTVVDITCNPAIGPEGGRAIRDGLHENRTLKNMDVRLCEMGKEVESAIGEFLRPRLEIVSSIVNTKRA